ncbi:hypothetical protein [Superficieibacter sp. HKU1]|uniref:hypothetical protein n=1 Tax=Superficieibacter sp. HKU1 TaxID=3031919 RepID=UPI0023E21D7C|nr:hypothetical protein [Superficieibacter sp. HKU1]WES69665.1 hypothetical protein P0H77_06660 [Superficieibacter sp. HKU1]
MEQLQRLACVIAETHIRDLKRKNGNALISNAGNQGEVNRDQLASGLVDNCLYAARNMACGDLERESYAMLCEMISLTGREYTITTHGEAVLESMHRHALSKPVKRINH